MSTTTLEEVLADELKDIYSAENQQIQVLPEMAAAAGSGELRSALETHLKTTRMHTQRIEEICTDLGIDPFGRRCMGMEGLGGEAVQVIRRGGDPIPLEAALIGATQRIEHYEIAAYGTARAHARQLGFMKAADLLGESLEEESRFDELLTGIAENRINVEAAMNNTFPQGLG